MFEIGLSTTGKNIDKDLFALYEKHGIKYMEVSASREMCDEFDFPKLNKIATDHSVIISSFHFPFRPFDTFDISSPDKNIRQDTIAYLGELMKRLADVGILRYVSHTGGKVSRENQHELDERIKHAGESFTILADLAESLGGRIAVENLPPVCVGTTVEELKKIVEADDRLGVCLDTNHMLSQTPVDFIKEFGSRIINTHISDYDRINERHWLPGEGVNDWYAIYDALCEADYKGIWLYEVAFRPLPTRIRERDITCEDFLQNAKEIFGKEKITVYSKPKPDLGFANS